MSNPHLEEHAHYADCALSVRDAFSRHSSELGKRQFRWLEADRRAFQEAAELEDWFQRRGLPASITLTEHRALMNDLADWHVALPYSEAERHLIFDIDRFGGNPEFIRAIGRTTILDCGVEQEVSGRELMQRWWNWRRGLKQFEGSHGVVLAQQALYRFAGRLVGPEQLPYDN